MKITIAKEYENTLLNRKEVTLSIDHEGTGTPTQKGVVEAYSASANVKVEHITVVYVRSGFGVTVSTAVLNVYDHPVTDWTSKEEKEGGTSTSEVDKVEASKTEEVAKDKADKSNKEDAPVAEEKSGATASGGDSTEKKEENADG